VSYYRTPEHRQLSADLIRRWRPWERSTGPKTAAGKAKVSKNGYKGGVRPALRALARAIRKQRIALAGLL
jgi:hypothetical protein